MQIYNVRLGFATNSSSTHSLIFLPGTKDKDVWGGEFGRQHFTAASESSKLLYIAMTMYYALLNNMDDEQARAVVKQLMDVELAYDGHGYTTPYIDHQSRYTLPLTADGKAVNQLFFDDFKKYMLQEDLVILGGNDNDGTLHPLEHKRGGAFELPIPLEFPHGYLVARKDGSYWTIFNKRSGAKIRFSFEELSLKPKSAHFPELVDLKITDFCTGNCPYCYQDASEEGKHADWMDIRAIARALHDMGVFEVAIGGGDAASHPYCVSTLELFRRNGIVPNFTTRDMWWLGDVERRAQILEAVGGVAVSVDNVARMQQLLRLVPECCDKSQSGSHGDSRISIHCIEGVVPRDELLEIMLLANGAGISVTLLGFKRVGRGSQYRECDSGLLGVIDLLGNSHALPALSVDTALASKYADEFADRGIPDVMYETAEGRFSMYIDAVNMKCGPSSFCDEEQMVDIDRDDICGSVADAFAQWNKKAEEDKGDEDD